MREGEEKFNFVSEFSLIGIAEKFEKLCPLESVKDPPLITRGTAEAAEAVTTALLLLITFEGVDARCMMPNGTGSARRLAASAVAAIADKAAAEPCLTAPAEDDLTTLRRVAIGEDADEINPAAVIKF